MTKRIKATEIQPGMIVSIYGGTERIPVTQAGDNGYGAVLITDGLRTRGLGVAETVELVGHFNP